MVKLVRTYEQCMETYDHGVLEWIMNHMAMLLILLHQFITYEVYEVQHVIIYKLNID